MVLSTRAPGRRPLVKALQGAGFHAEDHDGVVAVRAGVRVAVGKVSEASKDLSGSPELLLVAAGRLLGRAPRWRTVCTAESAAAPAEVRSALVDVAQALARCLPLAVLDDGSGGGVFLVHPDRGLIDPEQVRPLPPTPVQELLRGLLGPSR